MPPSIAASRLSPRLAFPLPLSPQPNITKSSLPSPLSALIAALWASKVLGLLLLLANAKTGSSQFALLRYDGRLLGTRPKKRRGRRPLGGDHSDSSNRRMGTRIGHIDCPPGRDNPPPTAFANCRQKQRRGSRWKIGAADSAHPQPKSPRVFCRLFLRATAGTAQLFFCPVERTQNHIISIHICCPAHYYSLQSGGIASFREEEDESLAVAKRAQKALQGSGFRDGHWLAICWLPFPALPFCLSISR